jgi:hypothetical protein
MDCETGFLEMGPLGFDLEMRRGNTDVWDNYGMRCMDMAKLTILTIIPSPAASFKMCMLSLLEHKIVLCALSTLFLH